MTAFVYSSFDLFSKLLDNPGQYGFKTSDICKKEGSIWCDHIHPTTRVHEEIAKDFVQFLRNKDVGEVAQVSKLCPCYRFYPFVDIVYAVNTFS